MPYNYFLNVYALIFCLHKYKNNDSTCYLIGTFFYLKTILSFPNIKLN